MAVAEIARQTESSPEATDPTFSKIDITYGSLINPLESGGENLSIVNRMTDYLNDVSADQDEKGNRIKYEYVLSKSFKERQAQAEKIVEDFLDEHRYRDTNDVGMSRDLLWVLDHADKAKQRVPEYRTGEGEFTTGEFTREAVEAQRVLRNYGYLRDAVLPSLPGIFEKGGAPVVDGVIDYALESLTSASTLGPLFLGLIATPATGLAAKAASLTAQQTSRMLLKQTLKKVMQTSAGRVGAGALFNGIYGTAFDAVDQNKDIYIDMADPDKEAKRSFSYGRMLTAGSIEAGAGAAFTLAGQGISKLANRRAQQRINEGVAAGDKNAIDLNNKMEQNRKQYKEAWDSDMPMMGKTVQVIYPSKKSGGIDSPELDEETLVISNSAKDIEETGLIQLQKRKLNEDGQMDVETMGSVEVEFLNTGVDNDIPYTSTGFNEATEESIEQIGDSLFNSPVQLKVLGGIEAKISMADELKNHAAKALDRQKAGKFAGDEGLLNEEVVKLSTETLDRIANALIEVLNTGGIVRAEKFSISEQMAQAIENGTIDGEDLGNIFWTHKVSPEDVANIFRSQASEAGRTLNRSGRVARQVASLTKERKFDFVEMDDTRRAALNERAALYKEYEIGGMSSQERFMNLWRMNLISGTVTTLRNGYGLAFQVAGQAGLRAVNNILNASINKVSGRVVYRDVNDIFDFKDLFLNTVNPRESLDLVEFAAVMRARPELQQQLFGRMGDVIVKMDENAKNSILTPFEKATQVANVLNLKFDEFTKSAAFHTKLRQQVDDAWNTTNNTPRYKVKVDEGEVTTEGAVGTGTFKQTISKYPDIKKEDLYTVREGNKDVLYRRLYFNDMIKENRMDMIESSDWEQALYFTRDIMFQKRVEDYKGGFVATAKGQPSAFLNTAPTQISDVLGTFLAQITEWQKKTNVGWAATIAAPFARFATAALDYGYRYTPGTSLLDLYPNKSGRQLWSELGRGDYTRFGENIVGGSLLFLAIQTRLTAGVDPRDPERKQETLSSDNLPSIIPNLKGIIPGTDGVRVGQRPGSYILKDGLMVDSTFLFPMYAYEVIADFIIKMNPGGFTTFMTGLDDDQIATRYGELDDPEFYKQLVEVATQNLGRGEGVSKIAKQMMEVSSGDLEAWPELSGNALTYIGGFFGGFLTKFREIGDYYSGYYDPESSIKIEKKPALPVVQKFVQEIYGVEGFSKLPKETQEVLSGDFVKYANTVLSAVTTGLPPLGFSWLEGELTHIQKWNLTKPVPERNYGSVKQRTGFIVMGYDSEIGEELRRLGQPEYRLYQKLNIPDYDNTFRRIGSDYFVDDFNRMFRNSDYIDSPKAQQIRIVKALRNVASTKTRNVIIERFPGLEIKRMLRSMSEAEVREAVAGLSKAEQEELKKVDIYTHKGAALKLVRMNKRIKARWDEIVKNNVEVLRQDKLKLSDAVLNK